MDGHTFDDALRSFAQSRRSLLTGSLALAAGWLGVSDATARNSRRKKKRRRKEEQKKSNTGQHMPEPTPQPTPPVCTPSCSGRTCGDDGCGGSCGTCGVDQVCQDSTCVCAPHPPATTCAGRCGTRTNNCGQPVACPCPAGQECLSNGSCAIVCDATADCGSTCSGCSNPSIEGARHCIAGSFNPDVFCTTTADCPLGSHCQDIGVKVCIRLCTEFRGAAHVT